MSYTTSRSLNYDTVTPNSRFLTVVFACLQACFLTAEWVALAATSDSFFCIACSDSIILGAHHAPCSWAVDVQIGQSIQAKWRETSFRLKQSFIRTVHNMAVHDGLNSKHC